MRGISKQQKKPAVAVSADATKCYDRTVHSISSMSCQHFSLQIEYILTLFSAMETIKMLVCTSFGVSTQFYTGSKSLPFQGGMQGNEAASPLWLILSIMLVKCLYALK